MPEGMLLRSPWVASNIADPNGDVDAGPLPARSRTTRWLAPCRCRGSSTTAAGSSATLPDVDRRMVVGSTAAERLRARARRRGEGRTARIVVAAGIGPFAWRPPEYAELLDALVSHAVEHHDLAGSRESGSSSSAAGRARSSRRLLHEAGAEVEVLVAPPCPLADPALAPQDSCRFGCAARPTRCGARLRKLARRAAAIFRRLPASPGPVRRRSLRPAGAAWLVRGSAPSPSRPGLLVVDAATRWARPPALDERTEWTSTMCFWDRVSR